MLKYRVQSFSKTFELLCEAFSQKSDSIALSSAVNLALKYFKNFLLSFCMILFLCFIGKQAACNPNLLLFTTVLSVVCGICHHSRIFPAKSYKNSRMRRL
ncbi:Hypothetical protein A7A1_0824 [Bacillus subtilis subsp. subtilis str. BSP1]|nr:Hypothetical protein A7A1_0824 [Bacillus subtilis subsp. subtilis str. BSP1]